MRPGFLPGTGFGSGLCSLGVGRALLKTELQSPVDFAVGASELVFGSVLNAPQKTWLDAQLYRDGVREHSEKSPRDIVARFFMPSCQAPRYNAASGYSVVGTPQLQKWRGWRVICGSGLL